MSGLREAVQRLADQVLAELVTEAGQRRGEPTAFARNVHTELRAILADHPEVES